MNQSVEDIVGKFIRGNDSNKFIIEYDIKRLKLTENEENFIINELEKNNISIKKDRRTRPQTVKDYTFGQVIESDDYQNDIPIRAKLTFDKDGNLISEDYTNLDNFLENKFIPNYIIMKTMVNGKTKENIYYPSIKLSDIVKLQCCELEVIHIMNYLKENKIRVTGSSTSLIGEFENYDYVAPTKNSEKTSLNTKNSPEITMEKLKKFKESNSLELRNEIIVENMRLAEYLAIKMNSLTHISKSELRSYAYEGLIKAVDRFDIKKGNQFSTYAYKAIKNTIFRGILQIWGYKLNDTNNNISLTRCMIEKQLNTTISESPEIADDIINSLVEKGYISSEKSHYYKRLLLLNAPQSLEDYLDNTDIRADNSEEYLMNDYNNDLLIDYNSLYDEKYDYDILLKESLAKLTPKEQKIIELYFGLNNNTPLSLRKCGDLFGISETAIRHAKNKALTKLKDPKISKKLKGLI